MRSGESSKEHLEVTLFQGGQEWAYTFLCGDTELGKNTQRIIEKK